MGRMSQVFGRTHIESPKKSEQGQLEDTLVRFASRTEGASLTAIALDAKHTAERILDRLKIKKG